MNIQLWRGFFSYLQKLEKEVIIHMFLVFLTLCNYERAPQMLFVGGVWQCMGQDIVGDAE